MLPVSRAQKGPAVPKIKAARVPTIMSKISRLEANRKSRKKDKSV